MPSTISVTLQPENFCPVPVVTPAGSHPGDIKLYSVMTEADCICPGTAGHALSMKPEWPRMFRDLPMRYNQGPDPVRSGDGFGMQPLQPGPDCLCHE